MLQGEKTPPSFLLVYRLRSFTKSDIGGLEVQWREDNLPAKKWRKNRSEAVGRVTPSQL